ncbi:MAG: hypothetical protein RLZZ71_2267 [Bacteroidota bacterium]|jgi:hypothetical protein
MAYQKKYKDEINVYDLIARFNELGYESLKELSSDKKSTAIVVEIKDGVEVEFTISEKNKLKFDLHLPYSRLRRVFQFLLALIFLTFLNTVLIRSLEKSGIQLGALAFAFLAIFFILSAVFIPIFFAKNAYKAKHPNVLNDIAQELNEI